MNTLAMNIKASQGCACGHTGAGMIQEVIPLCGCKNAVAGTGSSKSYFLMQQVILVPVLESFLFIFSAE